MGRPDYIFGQFWETAHAQHGGRVCCAFAPQLTLSYLMPFQSKWKNNFKETQHICRLCWKLYSISDHMWRRRQFPVPRKNAIYHSYKPIKSHSRQCSVMSSELDTEIWRKHKMLLMITSVVRSLPWYQNLWLATQGIGYTLNTRPFLQSRIVYNKWLT